MLDIVIYQSNCIGEVTGTAFTFTTLVVVASEHPPKPATVYVIVAEPGATAVTTPEVLTVATLVLLELHIPGALLPAMVNVVVLEVQTSWVPLMVPAIGGLVTVTVLVATASVQPPVPTTV